MSGNLADLTGIDVPTRLLIGGEWTGGRGGGTMPVIDPATEDALAEVAERHRRGRARTRSARPPARWPAGRRRRRGSARSACAGPSS